MIKPCPDCVGQKPVWGIWFDNGKSPAHWGTTEDGRLAIYRKKAQAQKAIKRKWKYVGVTKVRRLYIFLEP